MAKQISPKPAIRQSDTSRAYDELLVMLILAGDRRAMERLTARWHPRLLNTARKLLRDEDQAQEAAQEAWLGITRGWRNLSMPEKFPSWAFGILYRKCADRIDTEKRSRAVFTTLDDTSVAALNASPDDRISIDKALQALSSDHRIVAVLFFGEGLTLPEIAAAIKVPVGTVKSRIFHARRQLKAVLSGDEK